MIENYLRSTWVFDISVIFLEGRSFTVFTDHKPLTFSMSKVSKPWSARQQCHLSYISEFTTDIQHVHGKDNSVADALSRTTAVAEVHLGIDYLAMTEDQKQVAEVQDYRTGTTSLRLEDVAFRRQGVTLLCDMSTGLPRPIVPASWRRQVFDVVHSLSHPSVQTTRKLIAAKFV